MQEKGTENAGKKEQKCGKKGTEMREIMNREMAGKQWRVTKT